MNWITKQICEFIENNITSFISEFESAIVELFNKGVDLADTTVFKSAADVTTMLTIPLIIAMVLKELLNTYVLETDGDPDGDPLQLLVKASKTLCIACSNDVIFDFMNRIATSLMNDLNASVKPSDLFDSITDYFGFTEALTRPSTVIFILVYVIFVIILMAKAVFRGVELAFMKVLLPIMVVDGITVSSERWNAFSSFYVVTFVGYIPQMLAFSVSVSFFIQGLAGESINLLYSVGCLYFGLNVPKWLEKFTYKSGLGNAARGAMMSAVQLSLLKTRLG